MNDVTVTECPVCRGRAEEARTTGDWRDIRCPECGDYLISNSADVEFENLSPEQRRAELDRAKKEARPGQKPLIANIV